MRAPVPSMHRISTLLNMRVYASNDQLLLACA